MKTFLTLIALSASVSSFAAPEKMVVAKGLLANLNGVQKVQVLKLKRLWYYNLACSLHPDICFDGIKEYGLDTRVSTKAFGDLDYECHLDHYTRKNKINVRTCIPAGHRIEWKELNGGKTIISFKDH